jgi:hypothetical protein
MKYINVMTYFLWQKINYKYQIMTLRSVSGPFDKFLSPDNVTRFVCSGRLLGRDKSEPILWVEQHVVDEVHMDFVG